MYLLGRETQQEAECVDKEILRVLLHFQILLMTEQNQELGMQAKYHEQVAINQLITGAMCQNLHRQEAAARAGTRN